jgi:hypothetical protein
VSPITKVNSPGALVAEACGAGRQGFLEHRGALIGLAAECFKAKERPDVGGSLRR